MSDERAHADAVIEEAVETLQEEHVHEAYIQDALFEKANAVASARWGDD